MPMFAFDFPEGSASIELSRTADLLQAGDRAGAFVGPGCHQLDRLLWWPRRTARSSRHGQNDVSPSASYFWHAKLNNYDGVADVNEEDWTPVRAFRVLDEPAVIEGWTLTAQRLKPKGTCDRVLVSGVIRVDDNDDVPRARLTVVIQTDSGILAEDGPMVAIAATAPTYERTFCTRSGTLAVSLHVEDPAGQTTTSETRVATVPSARVRSPAQIVRSEYNDYKVALRTRDGARACELMSDGYWRSLRVWVSDYQTPRSCRDLVDSLGRVIYGRQRLAGSGVRTPRVRGKYASVCLTPFGRGAEYLVRTTTGWQLTFPASKVALRRYPKPCQRS